jgi:hypothetical protein
MPAHDAREPDPHGLTLSRHDDGMKVRDADGCEVVLSLWMVRGLLFDTEVRRMAQRWFLEQTAPYRVIDPNANGSQ